MTDRLAFISLIVAAVFGMAMAGAEEQSQRSKREAAKADMELGYFRDAAEKYRDLALDPAVPPLQAADDLYNAITCFKNVNLYDECDALLDDVAARRDTSWRLLASAALHRLSTPSSIAPAHRVEGGRRSWHSQERDRVYALRLFLKAEPLLDRPDDPPSAEARAEFYASFAGAVLRDRNDRHAWRLTALTDLNVLPDFDAVNPIWNLSGRGAPVDDEGNPVYYHMPASWEAAKNDGERWRWLLGRMAEVDEAGRARSDLNFGTFLLGQFGVQTMIVDYPMARDAEVADETGPYAVRTLGEDETIARLATGLRRFAMPDEFNHIKILRRVAGEGTQQAPRAMERLAQVFENRQQYHKAVSFWRGVVDAGDLAGSQRQKRARQSLERITGNNGMLEPGPVAPAGTRSELSYLFRNGKSVVMTAKRLDEKKLVFDIRSMLGKSGDKMADNRFMNPSSLGRWVVENGEDAYVAGTAAEWRVELSPPADYYSTRTRIELPFDAAGCYLVEAAMEDGNTSRVVLWITDLALIRKGAGVGQVLFVADPVTGEGVPDATVSFLGYESRYNQLRDRTRVIRDEFAEKTDADGLVLVDGKRMWDKSWLITAETADGRFAYQGFDSVWPISQDQQTDHPSAFVITDRPVYRPDQEINFKVWYAQASYWRASGPLSGRSVRVRIHDPRGEQIYDKSLTTDEFGGAADTLKLGVDAPLGSYFILVEEGGGLSFRLEEYKKPEFEVEVETPDKALVLGDKTRITVKAKYYYGSPVTDAKASYKIVRTPHTRDWVPPWRWDWLYGSGSWLVSYDYSWYPGWNEWGGCIGPRPPWMPMVFHQPEVVAEGEGGLDADGVLRIDLDTAPARELFGNQDHSYQVTVEVTDRSRRTIVGDGKVVASRRPFSVAVWADRGYYSTGQDIRVNLRAMLPLGGGVKASGQAVLHRIAYAGRGAPAETAGGSWDVATGDDGSAELRLTAGAAGQYRIACTLRDADGNEVEGAALITVRGGTGDGDFRFTALELVPDARDYRPGDTVRLAVNSSNKSGVVLLIPRAERFDGRKPPSVLRLENGSRVVDIPVGQADQPNFFCEAITIFGGKMYTETREIFVPPADKTLSVALASDKDSYAPGEKAEFTVKVTDADGRPVPGQCVVSIYDRSVEYISGGSNVGDIRSQFWGWKRYYGNRQVFSSLGKYPYSVEKRGDVRWEPIGMFGGREADWNDDAVYTNGRVSRPRRITADSVGPQALYQVPVPAAPMASAGYGSAEMAMPESDAYAADSASLRKNATVAVGGTLNNRYLSGGDAGGEAPVTVRSEFADTAFWSAALIADEGGNASFTVDMPENLTAWTARAWVMGMETRVGDGQGGVETRKNVIIRPQAPRFLTQKDQVVLSANLHNYLPRAKKARAELVLEGGLLEPEEGTELSRTLDLAAGGEVRVDWVVNARRPGEARVVMKLFTDEESDAAELKLPVIVHGARRVENFGGVVRSGENEAVIKFRVPDERLPDQSRLELTFSPSIASSMLEALPFLVEYPYGCTEQTLNRFLPVVMTRRYLDRMGLSLGDAKEIAGGAPKDAKSEEWKDKWGDPRAAKRRSPVFDDKELEAMVRKGVERLSAMQNADGGWGWFSGLGERSWPHTTAVVVHGLAAARDNGAAIPMGVFDQGVAWLRKYQDEQLERLRMKEDDEKNGVYRKRHADNLDAFVYMILAGQDKFVPDMRDFLYRDRLELSLSGLSMFGIALHRENATNALETVLGNLRQYLERDGDLGTAWLRTSASGWWWWYNDGVETQTWYLRLLTLVEPKGDVASGLAKYLLRNRKNGSYWRSTRDTAYAIEALSAYAVASGEAEPDMTVEVYLDGTPVMRRVLTAANILDDNRFVLEGVAVEAGEHELRLVRSGAGSLYYGGGLDVFSLEDPIHGSGLELKVDREFYKLVREEATADMRTATGAAAAGKVEKYRRERIPGPFDGDDAAKVALESGDLVEVELTIEAANDYEYLVFEDMKAAGLEAVELRSGYDGNRLGAYVEYRDRKVVLFVRHLPKGVYKMSYRFRAEVPGWFSALPVFGGGMYATDLFTNSNEMKVRIGEKGVYGE